MAGTNSRILSKISDLTKADIDEWWTGYSIAIIPVAGSWFAALAAGAAAWAGTSLLLRRYEFDIPKESLPLVLSCAALGIWAMFTGSYHDGLAGLYKGTIFAAPLFALSLLISRYRASDPRRSYQALANYALVGLALAVVIASTQYLLGQVIEGAVGNSYVFGFVCVSLAILASSSDRIGQFRHMLLFSLTNFAILLVLFKAEARTHLIFLFLFLLIFLLKMIKNFIHIVYTLIFISATSIYIFFPLITDLYEDISQVTGYGANSSFGIRLELWKAGALKINEAPVFGTGFLSKMQEISILLPEHVAYLQFTHLHNIFIDAAVSMGLPGMLLVAAIMLAAYKMMSALGNPKRNAGNAFLALCLFHGSLGPIFTHDIVASIFIVVLAVFASCVGRETGHRA